MQPQISGSAKVSRDDGETRSRPGIWRRMLRSRQLMTGLVLFLLVSLAAVVLPPLLGLDPYGVNTAERLSGMSADYPLGSDDFGRDLLSRLLVGAQTSLIVGGSVALLSGVIGTVIGISASFFRPLDQVLMRICDGLMAIPAILLAVLFAAALGPSIPNLILALTLVFTPNVARLVRSRALTVLSETFVEASRVQGASALHIIIRHVLPNTLSVLAVQVTFIFADSVTTEAALSFLGAGVPTPEPSWGNVLYDGRGVILQFPLMTIVASLSLVLTVFALNLIGDGLRDAIDPRAGDEARGGGMMTRLFGGWTKRKTGIRSGARGKEVEAS